MNMYKTVPKKIAIRAYSISLIRNITKNFFKIKIPKKWLFIIGCYRSGTTLLKNLLSYHPKISSLPEEGVLFTQYLSRPEEFGWTYMWLKCKDKIQITRKKEPEIALKIIKDWSPWFNSNSEIFLEKSIANILRIGWLEENFQPAFFIGIVRNGLAVAESIRRKAQPSKYKNPIYKSQYPIELCAKEWLESIEIMTKEFSKVSKWKLIRYEDLTQNPVEILRNLWEWLDLKPEPLSFKKGVLEIRNKKIIIKNRNSENLSRLTKNEKKKIWNIIKSGMIKMGYSNENY